jgi:two-component system LytT family response regulator
MIRTVVIENEVNAQKLLVSILKEYTDIIEIIGVVGSVEGARMLIEKNKPELVFMDIELDDGNAFDLLEKIENRSFKLIFVTAYDNYALKAFEYEAIDYLVKPYSPNEVVKAVNRVQQIPVFDTFRDELLALLIKEKNQNAKITLSTVDGIDIVRIGDIIRLEAERSYCSFFLKGGKKIMVSKPLKEFEAILPSVTFFRVHQSHLINLDFVRQVSNEDGGCINMENGEKVPLAKRRKKEFIAILEK